MWETKILHDLEVVPVPVATVRVVVVVDPPTSTYICSPVLVPQIAGGSLAVGPLAVKVPMQAPVVAVIGRTKLVKSNLSWQMSVSQYWTV